MGEEPGSSGPAVTETQDPEQIKRQIDATREELGDTVEALAAKTDVKAQAKRKVEETRPARLCNMSASPTTSTTRATSQAAV